MNGTIPTTSRGGERLRRGTPEHAARLEGMLALARAGWTLSAIAAPYQLTRQSVAYALRGAGLTITEVRNLHCARCGKPLSRARYFGALDAVWRHYCGNCEGARRARRVGKPRAFPASAELRALRNAAGLSQRALAALAFCSPSMVSALELDRRQSPELRQHLAAVLVAQKAVQP